MFSWTVAENRNGSSSTTAIARRSAPQVELAHVGAVDQDRARRRRRRAAASSCTSVVLPEPVAPTSATVVPASTTRSTSRSAGAARVLVGERHVAQLDAPAALGQRPARPAGATQRGSRSSSSNSRAPEAVARWASAERDAELAHRRDQHQQVGVEGGEVAERERPVDDLAAADEQDHGEPEVRQEADERVVEGAQPGRVHRLVEHARDRRRGSARAGAARPRRPYHAHARDVLLDVGGQLGDPLLDLLQRRARAPPVARGDQHDERHRRERERASPGCSSSIATAASRIVSALWTMKTSP